MPSNSTRVQLAEIGAILSARTDELAQQVVESIRGEVPFYRDSTAVTDAELIDVATANLTLVFQALQDNSVFDTAPAAAAGRKRALAGVPLTAVMSAFRVAGHHVWETSVDLPADHGRRITRGGLLGATARFWDALDRYTEAMAMAYHDQVTQDILENAAQDAALTEALLQGRPLGDYSVWDVAQLLGIPATGPYVVFAAKPPRVGQLALANVQATLARIHVCSAWRLLPDVQIGIAHIASDSAWDKSVAALRRLASTPVGASPPFQDLTDTALSLRYARVAMDSGASGLVTVFQDSVLGVAAVSAPEVTRKLSEMVLGSFADLPGDERTLLRDTFASWLDHNGSISDTASALFCHPNTVRNRLRRIEARTGKRLDHPRQLAELCLSFEVIRSLDV